MFKTRDVSNLQRKVFHNCNKLWEQPWMRCLVSLTKQSVSWCSSIKVCNMLASTIKEKNWVLIWAGAVACQPRMCRCWTKQIRTGWPLHDLSQKLQVREFVMFICFFLYADCAAKHCWLHKKVSYLVLRTCISAHVNLDGSWKTQTKSQHKPTLTPQNTKTQHK